MSKPAKPRILLIEDEDDVRKTLRLNLKEHGYKVSTAATGVEGLAMARADVHDLVILDLMLPGIDGLSLVRALRQESEVPVLMLTARSSEMDKIIGLESGADDYLTKPFSMGELLARVRALLRRTRTPEARDELKAGDLHLDLISRRAARGNHPLNLSLLEFSLLAELMRHQGAVLSRDLLLTRVWGEDFFGEPRTVDVHVRWLREKIEEDPSQPRLIQTVRGVGYRFEAPAASEPEDEEE